MSYKGKKNPLPGGKGVLMGNVTKCRFQHQRRVSRCDVMLAKEAPLALLLIRSKQGVINSYNGLKPFDGPFYFHGEA